MNPHHTHCSNHAGPGDETNRADHPDASDQMLAERCLVSPSPELRERLAEAAASAAAAAGEVIDNAQVTVQTEPRWPGFNDGLIIPGTEFPLGTPYSRVANAAADRAPLRGQVRVVVVLVDFPDRSFDAAHDVNHFRNLFFSQGTIPTGSVREFFTEASHGLVDLQGEVVGPYRMPRSLTSYANGQSGTGQLAPNARTMARDAAIAADPHIDFAPYDNDGNGYVDAFVVVHAGTGAEMSGNTSDIWSHKWVLGGGAYSADTTNIYAYLTVPEDCRTGVCAHELGHLLFGWPDLYDTDGSSEGVGAWCLMGAGSWNGGGATPAHPSAWCKAQQGWVTVANETTARTATIVDVKAAPHTVHRLWRDGASGSEYFLVENRQRSGFDSALPGEGLLIWHIDDAIANNTGVPHARVALEQADASGDLDAKRNRGDGGDTFPGTAANTEFAGSSTPSSASYSGAKTCVSITDIGPSSAAMSASFGVSCVRLPTDLKWLFKEHGKDPLKEQLKEHGKEPFKDGIKELGKEFKEHGKELKDVKEFRETFDPRERPWERAAGDAGTDVERRLSVLETAVGELVGLDVSTPEPFIGSELRPDLSGGAMLGEPDRGERRPGGPSGIDRG